jgi:predicted extracellular nuclease
MSPRALWLALLASGAAQADILINESDADTPSTDVAEFIELYNGGSGVESLTGLSLVFFNGSNDSSYFSLSLDGYETGDDGYFVVCGDAAQVAGCDLDVSPDSNLIQNGADAVALYRASATAFPNGTAVTTENLIDAVVYDTNDSDDTGLLPLLASGEPQLNEDMNSAKDTQSLQRCSGAARETNGWSAAAPTPGGANACDIVPEPLIGSCGDPATGIHAIQGNILDVNADASPLLGSLQVVEAIVVADLQGGPLANGDSSYQYSGYWLQQADHEVDNDDMTSEGIFVYDYRSNVSVGDRVRLMANVSEYNQVTQLSQVADYIVCAQNQALPESTSLSLPVTSLTEWEALEGMRVHATAPLVVSDLYGTGYGLGNYGQFVVSSRLHFQGTEIALPGSEVALAANAQRTLDALLIDDGVSASYPEFIPFPDETGLRADNPLRIGDEVAQLSGVMHAYRNNFMVIPAEITIDPVNPRTLSPQVAVDADLVIAGMNVLNYFNGDGMGGGFPTSRGAPTPDALEMQGAKIVAALTAINADVIGLMEIENDGYGEYSAIRQLVAELNAQQLPGDEYSVVVPAAEILGSDEIAVGLIYRAERVTPVGQARVLSSDNSPLDEQGEPLFDDTRNRPALIQTFAVNGSEITLAVNHLKSKGSACGEENEGADGQGNCNNNRTRAAQALVGYLADDARVLVLGDLNAYSQEDPMQVFYAAGFSNLKYSPASTEAQPFSYSFSGLLGSLDHALASSDLTADVVSVDAWHINSVEDSLMDYLTEENGQPYSSVDHYAQPDAYRSSDHDPIVVGLKMVPENTAPVQVEEIPAIEISRRNQSYQLDLTPYFDDADNDELAYTLMNSSAPAQVTEGGLVQVYSDRDLMNQLPLTLLIEISDGQSVITAQVQVEDSRRPVWSDVINWLINLFSRWFNV